MTLELQQSLERELNDSLAIEDPIKRSMAVDTALVHLFVALVDCQRKTSERVKQLIIAEDRRAERKKGMQLAISIFKWLAIAGGGRILLDASALEKFLSIFAIQ